MNSEYTAVVKQDGDWWIGWNRLQRRKNCHLLMKRIKLLKYLRSHGCNLLREGSKHSWWNNPVLNKRSAIPRHSEIKDILVIKICKDLGVTPIK